MSDTESKKTLSEISEIQKELNAQTDDVKASKLMGELVDVAYRGGRVTEFEIEHYIEEYLAIYGSRYPSLMDVCNGNERKAVAYVRQYMTAEAAWGNEHTIQQACGHIEIIASRYVMGLPAVDKIESRIIRVR